jgi:dolichol-phosphate mannosyltransferase
MCGSLTREDKAEVDSKVCVVIPTYNEAENLPDIVGSLLGLGLPRLQIVIVDDASPDGTGAIADELAASHSDRIHVLHRPSKQGIGPAYVEGFKAAVALQPDVIVQMDADLSHQPKTILGMLNTLETADVVVGSRYVDGGSVDMGWGWARRALSRYGNAYTRLVGGVRVRDASSGFKAFRRNVVDSLPLDSLQCKGFGFQAEVTMACQRLNFRLIEHPIDFVDRKKGDSKISWWIVWEALWRLPLIRINHLISKGSRDYPKHREN